jgi:hypothetical protein
MAFQLPATPNFNVQVPQMPNALDTAGKAASLQNMLSEAALRKQLAPLDVQEAQQRVQQQTIQTQQAQQAMDSQKKLQDAIANGTFNKYAAQDVPDGSGFDAAGAYQELVTKHGVLPAQASAAVESLQKIGQTMAEQRKTNAQAAEANATVRSKTLDALSAKLGSIGDMPATKAVDALDAFHQDLVNNPKAYPGLTQQELAHLYSADLTHLPAVTQLMGLEGKIADYHKGQAAATKEQQEATNATPQGTAAKASAEAQARLNVESSPQAVALAGQKAALEATARQSAAQGSPEDAGKLLASGDLTLADLKSRGTTPKFITAAVAAAQKEKPGYNPADEVIAESVAHSQSANQFFGSANSLITKGGTLDQLEKQGRNIPSNQLPVLNSVEDWMKLAAGKGPLAGYAATALGVADDYGKVMGGGTASDHARDAALQLFAKAASPEQRADAIKATRDAVQSQRDSRIGNNQFLKRQYGAEVSTGAPTMIRARDPQGVLHEAKEGTALPKGWTLEK